MAEEFSTTMTKTYEFGYGTFHYLFVGKDVWVINVESETLSSWMWDHETEVFKRIDMKTGVIENFRNFYSSKFCASDENIFMLKDNGKQLYEFNTKTFCWRLVIEVEHPEFRHFLVHNNMMYGHWAENKVMIVSLETGSVLFRGKQPNEVYQYYGNFVIANGFVHLVYFDINMMTTILQYDEINNKFIKLRKIDTPIPTNVTNKYEYNRSFVWSLENTIFIALDYPISKTVQIDLYDIQSRKVELVGDLQISRRDTFTFHTIFGTTQEIHMLSTDHNTGDFDRFMQFYPKLQDLALKQLADQTTPEEKESVAEKLPCTLQNRFKKAFNWDFCKIRKPTEL